MTPSDDRHGGAGRSARAGVSALVVLALLLACPAEATSSLACSASRSASVERAGVRRLTQTLARAVSSMLGTSLAPWAGTCGRRPPREASPARAPIGCVLGDSAELRPEQTDLPPPALA